MRRSNATRSGLPAVALSLMLAGCGGGSGGGEESLVVDLRDPAFAGPQGAAPPAPAPAEAPAEAEPIPGAPMALAAEAAPPAGPGSGSPIAAASPTAEAPAVAAPAGPAGEAAAAPASAVAATEGAASGDLALNEMLAAANSANDPSAARGRSQGLGGPQGPEGSSPDSGAMAGYEGASPDGMAPGDAYGGTPYETGVGDVAGNMADGGGFEGDFGPGGFDGMPGQPGAVGEAKPGNFESPQGAITAFMDALKARDLQRLQEATALRAPREAATESRRKTFQAIRELSLSPEELEAIARDFDGFQVAQMAPLTTAGVVTFILRKQGEFSSILQRTVDVRKERAGWKISDVTGAAEIKQIGGRAMQQRYDRNRDRNQGGESGDYGGQP